MNKKLRPIVKWTGGKYDEFASFAQHIPKFDRYIEPFFGGGGVFFALQPKGKSLINDKSTDLINFYQQIGQANFKTELFKYADAWDELKTIHEQLWAKCATTFKKYIKERSGAEELNEKLLQQFETVLAKSQIFNQEDFLIDTALFKKLFLSSIFDKARRIKNICKKEARTFSVDELKSHFETGIRSGVYLFFRRLLNQQYKQQVVLPPAKAAANWYFVREFCYGSMFRFNAKGEFNIPYGGIAYNKRKFRYKAEKMFRKGVTDLFEQTEIHNLDFEVFLANIDLQPKDFIFLDPPYDTEFSEYDQSAFTQEDQQRLASFLIQTKAQWMVVIKETAFIREIYTHPKVKILTFDKSYTYNVRGRNNRAVKHLIITNK